MARRQLTRAQARAALGDMPERSFARLVSEGLPRRGEGRRIRFPWPEIFIWCLKREREKAAASLRPTTAQASEAERRERCAKAEIAELRAGELAGRLVPLEDYRREIARIGNLLRAAILAMPGRNALGMVGLATPAHAMAKLQEVARDLLVELQRTGKADDSEEE